MLSKESISVTTPRLELHFLSYGLNIWPRLNGPSRLSRGLVGSIRPWAHLPSRVVVKLSARQSGVVKDERVPRVGEVENRVPRLARGRRVILFSGRQKRKHVLQQQVRQVVPVASVFDGRGSPSRFWNNTRTWTRENSKKIPTVRTRTFWFRGVRLVVLYFVSCVHIARRFQRRFAYARYKILIHYKNWCWHAVPLTNGPRVRFGARSTFSRLSIFNAREPTIRFTFYAHVLLLSE